MRIFEANHGLTDPAARDEKVAEAQRILARAAAAPDGRWVGVAIGFVQSGKTMSFTTLTALAADNGYRVVVVILGNTKLLVSQNRERLADDLGIGQRDDWRWAHLSNPPAKTDLDQYLAQDDRVVLITVLKHAARLNRVAEILEHSALGRGVKALVIDDEADQASLNAGVRKGKETPTYRSILRLRKALGAHLYMQYTATPFAPLLLEKHDGLSPQFAELLTPGEDYTGGRTFFLEHPDTVVRRIDDDEADEKAPSKLPAGLDRALRTFLTTTAYQRAHGELSSVSMLIHTSGLKGDHATVGRLVGASLSLWANRLSLPDNDVGKRAALDRLRDIRDDVVDHGVAEVDDATFASAFTWVVRMARVWLVNSADEGENPDWALTPVNVLIGGNKLDRGFTVRGLTTTYLTRKAAGGQADTIEQRARCYGYKRRYLRYCRVFAPDNVVNAFTALVHTEADMRASISAWQEEGRPLGEWSAAEGILLPDDIRPTRTTVVKNPYQRTFTEWSFLRRPSLDASDVGKNRELLERIRVMDAPQETFGEVSMRLLRGLAVTDVVDDLLEPWRSGASPGWDKPTLLRGLRGLSESGIHETMDVTFLELTERRPRVRAWREPGGFDQLMQGENTGTGYPGDRNVVEGLHLQVHHVVPRDASTPTLALALYVPLTPGGVGDVARRR